VVKHDDVADRPWRRQLTRVDGCQVTEPPHPLQPDRHQPGLRPVDVHHLPDVHPVRRMLLVIDDHVVQMSSRHDDHDRLLPAIVKVTQQFDLMSTG
jgi:hypothetical protein